MDVGSNLVEYDAMTATERIECENYGKANECAGLGSRSLSAGFRHRV